MSIQDSRPPGCRWSRFSAQPQRLFANFRNAARSARDSGARISVCKTSTTGRLARSMPGCTTSTASTCCSSARRETCPAGFRRKSPETLVHQRFPAHRHSIPFAIPNKDSSLFGANPPGATNKVARYREPRQIKPRHAGPSVKRGKSFAYRLASSVNSRSARCVACPPIKKSTNNRFAWAPPERRRRCA